MLIFRRPVSIIRNGHKLLKPRLFHSSPLLEAKYAPKRSPTVSAKLRQSPNATRVPKTHDPEACLPPLVLLQSGHKSGALPIDPHKALDVLRRYQALAIGSNAGWEQRLCTGTQTLRIGWGKILICHQSLKLHHRPWSCWPGFSIGAHTMDKDNWHVRSCCLHPNSVKHPQLLT
jgi:hypothetical protein